MKRTQLTDDVPQQHQSGLDLHPFDSILMMSQSGSQYSSGRMYVQDICMRHPVSTSHLGHCSPKQLLTISWRRSGGKQGLWTRLNRDNPSRLVRREHPKVLKSPAQVQFSFNLWPWGLYILFATRVSGRQKIKSSWPCIFMSIWKSSRGAIFFSLLHSNVIPDLQKKKKKLKKVWVEGCPEEDFSCSKDFKWSWWRCHFVSRGKPPAGLAGSIGSSSAASSPTHEAAIAAHSI